MFERNIDFEFINFEIVFRLFFVSPKTLISAFFIHRRRSSSSSSSSSSVVVVVVVVGRRRRRRRRNRRRRHHHHHYHQQQLNVHLFNDYSWVRIVASKQRMVDHRMV